LFRGNQTVFDEERAKEGTLEFEQIRGLPTTACGYAGRLCVRKRGQQKAMYAVTLAEAQFG
jgi:hypothetical protein